MSLKAKTLSMTPLWAACTANIALAGLLSIAALFSPYGALGPWVAVIGLAPAAATSLFCLLWVHSTVKIPLKRHQERLHDALTGGLQATAFLEPNPYLNGLGSILDGFACDMRAALINVAKADAEEKHQALQLTFEGDAAEQLDKLYRLVEDSDSWIRQRQDALLELHSKVADQAAGATQTLEQLAQQERDHQAHMQSFLNAAPDALEHLMEQLESWRSLDPAGLEGTQRQLTQTAETFEATVQSLQTGSGDILSTAAALKEAEGMAQSSVSTLSDVATQSASKADIAAANMDAAGVAAKQASEKLEVLAKGGKDGLLRALRQISQASGGVQDAAAVLEESRAKLTDQSRAFTDATQEYRADMLAAVEGFGGSADDAVQALQSDLEETIARNQDALSAAAQSVADAARAAVQDNMAGFSSMSQAHADLIKNEMQLISDHGALLQDGRKAAATVQSLVGHMEVHAKEAQEALAAHLSAQEDILAPMQDLARRVQDPLETLVNVDTQHFARLIVDLEKLTSDLARLKDIESLPQLEDIKGALGGLSSIVEGDVLPSQEQLMTSVTQRNAALDAVAAQISSQSDALSAAHKTLDALSKQLSQQDMPTLMSEHLDTVKNAVADQVTPACEALSEDQRAVAEQLTKGFESQGKTISIASKALDSLSTRLPEEGLSAALSESLKTLERSLARQIKSLGPDAPIEELRAQLGTLSSLVERDVVPAREEILSAVSARNDTLDGIAAQISEQSDALTTTSKLVKSLSTRTSAQDQQDILDARLKSLEAFFTDQLKANADALNAQQNASLESLETLTKALRAQLRKLANQVQTQTDTLSDGVKQLRVGQIQPLKRSIKALPSDVAKHIAPDVSARFDALERALEARTEQQSEDQSPQDPIPAPDEPDIKPDLNDASAALSERLNAALKAMEAIETEVTSLATAALAAPKDATQSTAFNDMLVDAEKVLSTWNGKVENISTAIALAQDAA